MLVNRICIYMDKKRGLHTDKEMSEKRPRKGRLFKCPWWWSKVWYMFVNRICICMDKIRDLHTDV